MKLIGTNQHRKDSRAKLAGSAQFTADMRYDGMWHGVVVRAPLPHGRIVAIRKGSGVDWSRVAFATAQDIPGSKRVKMIAEDMPFLAEEVVHYKGEPVALIAAPTLAEAEAARRAVVVEMTPLPAILTLKEVVRCHHNQRSALEELARWQIHKADAAAAIAKAEIVLESCYTTPHQEQAYLETNAITAVPEGDDRMRVEGSLQCPYYVAPAVAAMLGTDLDHLHVRALPMGGAFGGKEDFPSLLGGHAALLARLCQRPVRMVLQRSEDMAYTTKRHPSWIRIKAGIMRDGRLNGIIVEIIFDGGAYVTMSPVVLSRGAIHAAGAYSWPAVAIDAVAYRTHTPPNGAFRGFGVPQTAFAIESHIDQLAAACGMEPHLFRQKNCLKSGDLTATSQVLTESVGSEQVLATALRATDFERKLRLGGLAALQPDARWSTGIGMAFFWHGAGFTGGGEAKIAARVALDLCDDGQAHIRVSSTEMGQGAHTVLCQIVAQELGVPLDHVVCDPVDTRSVPDSGPTVASRTTMIVGGELASCARRARRHVLQWVAEQRGLMIDDLEVVDGVIVAGTHHLTPFAAAMISALQAEDQPRWEFSGQHRLASHLKWDEPTHQGDAYATYGWGCTVAEVEVDRDLFEVRVIRVTVVVDIGKAINPLLAKGQVEGGTLQALGFALSEEVGVQPSGELLRNRFQTYILPTFPDAPPIEVHLVEQPYSRGPGGAKGLGEMPLNGGAPAVANAVAHALGVRVVDLPITPEKIYTIVQERSQ